MKIKEQYQELVKSHSLPDFDSLNDLFSISQIDCDDAVVLSQIRKTMVEKIDHYAKIIFEYLQPENNFASMYEAQVFSDDERKELLTIYKQLMVIYNTSIVLSLSNDQVKLADFINRTTQDWSSIKERLAQYFSKVALNWTKNEETTSDIGYLG